MIKKEYYKACDLFITSPLERKKSEYFNEYGYNIASNRKNVQNHFFKFSHTNQNNVKIKPKR